MNYKKFLQYSHIIDQDAYYSNYLIKKSRMCHTDPVHHRGKSCHLQQEGCIRLLLSVKVLHSGECYKLSTCSGGFVEIY